MAVSRLDWARRVCGVPTTLGSSTGWHLRKPEWVWDRLGWATAPTGECQNGWGPGRLATVSVLRKNLKKLFPFL